MGYLACQSNMTGNMRAISPSGRRGFGEGENEPGSYSPCAGSSQLMAAVTGLNWGMALIRKNRKRNSPPALA
jgi:hypothetical protein